MIKVKFIKDILKKSLDLEKIFVYQKNTNYSIIAVSNIFLNLDLLERHKIILKILAKYIKKKHIHSVVIETYSLDEWNKNNN